MFKFLCYVALSLCRANSLLQTPRPGWIWNGVEAAACSPDGREVLAACDDSRLREWDLDSGEIKRTYPFQVKGNWAFVIYSPDSKLVAAGAWDDIVRICDRDSGRLLKEIRLTAWPTTAAWSPDSQTLVVGEDGSSEGRHFAIQEFSVATGASTQHFSDPRLVDDLALSGDGRWIYAEESFPQHRSTLIVLRFPALSPVRRISQTVLARGVAETSDRSVLVTGSFGQGTELIDPSTGYLLHATARGPGGSDARAAVSKDGLLATAAADTVILSELASGRVIRRLLARKGASILALCFTPDGRKIVEATVEGIWVWDAGTGDILRILQLKPDGGAGDKEG